MSHRRAVFAIPPIRKEADIFLGYVATLFAFTCSSVATVAPIPVLHYGFGQQESDPYDVEVIYKPPFTAEQRAVIDSLKEASIHEGGGANITVSLKKQGKVFGVQSKGIDLPCVRVSYPKASGISAPFWTEHLDSPLIEGNLLHSPKRQRIVENLLQGKTAVWVLLASGDETADIKARARLEEELARLEKTLSFPNQEMNSRKSLPDNVDFSLVTLRRDAPHEQVLVKMLLSSERDLKTYENKPIAFPVYGRGLILYALVGDGINERTVTAVGEFLTGSCSTCFVTDHAVGVNMLASFDRNQPGSSPTVEPKELIR